MKPLHGFSLLEILFTLTIIAIMATLSLPQWETLWLKSAAQIAYTQLQEAINFTRNQAISHHMTVTLCASRDQVTCSGQWQDGFLVKTDTTILRVFQPVMVNGLLFWRSFPHNQNHLDFLSSGLPHAENGTFWYCTAHTPYPHWALIINRGGRVRAELPNSNGFILDDKGKILDCSVA